MDELEHIKPVKVSSHLHDSILAKVKKNAENINTGKAILALIPVLAICYFSFITATKIGENSEQKELENRYINNNHLNMYNHE